MATAARIGEQQFEADATGHPEAWPPASGLVDCLTDAAAQAPLDWLVAELKSPCRRPRDSVLWVEAGPPVQIATRALGGCRVVRVTPPQLKPLTTANLPPPPTEFDVIVLSHVLGAVRDLDLVAARVASLLPPEGLLLVEELCWERLDVDTARWFFGFQDAIARERRCRVSKRLLADRLNDWRAEHAGLNTGAAIADALQRWFEIQSLHHAPALGPLLDWEHALEYEQLAIDAGVIQTTGVRLVGRPAPRRRGAPKAG